MLHMKRTFQYTFKGSLTDFLTIARQFAQSRGYIAYKELLWNLSVEPHDSLAKVYEEFIHFCFDPIVRIPTEQKAIEIDLDTVLERRPKQGNEDLILRIIKIWMDKHGNCKWVYAKVFGYQLNNITRIDVYSKIKDDSKAEDNFEIEPWQVIEPIWMELVGELRQHEAQMEQQAGNISVITVQSKPEQETKQRGIKLGTAARVTEFHRLVKSDESHRQAKKRANCDPSTYYRWCKEVTGEEPIKPYR